MKELFVPYELAVMLKERGFNEPCFGCFFDKELSFENIYQTLNKMYNSEVDGLYPPALFISNNSYPYGVYSPIRNHIECIAAPMYQQVVDFLREKHGFHVAASTFHVYDGKYGYTYSKHSITGGFMPNFEGTTYYEALAKAIKEALKYIK